MLYRLRLIGPHEMPTYFVPGEATFQTFPRYACNAVHLSIWSIEPGGLTIKFKVADSG